MTSDSDAGRVDLFDVASFFVAADAEQPEPDVTPLKLQKLVYFAQANYLAWTGFRLFNEPVEAFDNGPVIFKLFKRFAGNRDVLALDKECVVEPQLPPDVRAFLELVWNTYAGWSSTELWRLTHSQAPWRDNYVQNGYRIEIPDAEIIDYYRSDAPLRHRILPCPEEDLSDELLESFEARRHAEGVGSKSLGLDAIRRRARSARPIQVRLVG